MSQSRESHPYYISSNLSLETRFQQAREALAKGEVKNKKEAAALVPMNPSTFNHHFRGRKLAEQTWAEMQALSPQEEDILVRRCSTLSKCGFPPSIWKVHDIAVEIGQERDPNFTLSDRWMDKSGFYKRHPEVQRGYSHPIDAVCIERGNNLAILLGFFKQYLRIVKDYSIKPQNTYNLDEIGFVMGLSSHSRVLEPIRHPRRNGLLLNPEIAAEVEQEPASSVSSNSHHRAKKAKFLRKQPGTREFVTVLETICGDGSVLDPPIIFKAEDMLSRWFDNVDHNVPEGILFGKSPNGWTDQEKSLEYLERNFGPESLTAQKAGTNEYRCLIFDGHNSHVNSKFLNRCLDLHVIPCCLPPHTSHKYQPLDVAVFSPLKTHYRRILQERFENNYSGVYKDNFYLLLIEARVEAMTSENIKKGFSATGLVPPSLAVPHQRILQESGIDSLENYNYASDPGNLDLLPDRLTPVSEILARNATPLEATPELVPINALDFPPPPFFQNPEPLHNLSIDQVTSLSPVESFQDFLHTKELLLNSFPISEPTSFSWKQQFLTQSLLSYCEHQYHKCLEVEKENWNLKNRVQEYQTPKSRKRRRGCLPSSGQAWQSKTDISNFFSTQSTAEKTRKKEKLVKLRNDVIRFEKFLETAKMKFQDRITKENQKRLPTNQLSSARVFHEYVLPATQRLEKARDNVRQLEDDILSSGCDPDSENRTDLMDAGVEEEAAEEYSE